jgi:hypothetical protein
MRTGHLTSRHGEQANVGQFRAPINDPMMEGAEQRSVESRSSWDFQ